jgi:hypothetical protein
MEAATSGRPADSRIIARISLYSTFVPVRRSAIAVLLGSAACYGVLAITEPPGPGLDPDSMSYLGAAESLVRHGTLRIPSAQWSDADSTQALGHFPPGFPLAIAVPAALGAAPGQAARGVEAVAAFATIALAVGLVGAAAGSGAGLLAGVVLLVTPAFAFDHWQVVSEPLCVALLMATLGLMVYSKRPWTYGIAAAAAGMVRYAAVASTGAVVLWAYGLEGSRRERLRRAAIAAAPSVIFQALWVLRAKAESAEVRSFGLRGGLGATFEELAGTVGGWLAPSVANPWLRGVAAVAVGAITLLVLARVARRSPASTEPVAQPRRFLAAVGLLAGCYAALVLFSRLFVDQTIPFDQRILSPFIVLAEVAAVAAFAAGWRGWSGRVRAAVGVAGLVWLAGSAAATVRAVADALDGGWGYAGDEWRTSPLGAWLRTAGRGTAIFSNNTATAWFVTHRPSRGVPETLDADSVAAFGRVLGEQRGVLVRFPFDLEEGAPPDSLAKRLGLSEMARFPEGVVWGPARQARSRGAAGE